MARAKTTYVCQACGTAHNKWAGQCTGCGEWNTLVEEIPVTDAAPKGLGAKRGRALTLTDLHSEEPQAPRMLTGIAEFDRAVGGGLVPGSALLIGGDPGIGKSTIVLQALAGLARTGLDCVYISGEEAAPQVRLRALRLGLTDAPVKLGTETNLRDILTTLAEGPAPDIVVIDSIQTLFADTLDSAPGTVAQLRSCTAELVRFAKKRNTVMLIVGHVTKDGQIAGPRVLEHMVDTVLYFEGDRGHQFRILRAVKNRFGGTDEIGVFEMTSEGLAEVPNPSDLFLSTREKSVPGSAVFAGIEGTRPMLIEIQALVAPTSAANPRRAVVGWDTGRLAMVLAVLDARCGLGLSGCDVYLNVAGGLRIVEPAADLAVASALVSSLLDRPVPDETVVFGEISLSGEVRPVPQMDARLKEAQKLGFSNAWMPAGGKVSTGGKTRDKLDRLAGLVDLLGGVDE